MYIFKVFKQLTTSITLSSASLGIILLFGSTIQTVPAQAEIISNVKATTNMGTFGSYNIENLTNGNGLSSEFFSATHSNDFNTMWVSNEIKTGSITFDLGRLFNVNRFAVWNYNAICCGLQRSVKTFTVDVSANNVLFKNILGSTNLSIAGGGQEASQIFDIEGSIARYLKFNILSSYNDFDDFTGLSEVQFDATSVSVPEPKSFGETAVVGAMFWWIKRKRKTSTHLESQDG